MEGVGDVQARVLAAIGVLAFFLGLGIGAVQGGATLASKFITLAGLALIAIAGALAIGHIVSLLRTRQGRYGVNVVGATLAAIGIVVVLNILGTRYAWRTDVTATQRFSLSPQTMRVIESMDTAEATIFTFVTKDTPGYSTTMDLVEGYDDASLRVSLRTVNPFREPGLLDELRVKDDTWIAIRVEDRVERLSDREVNEEAVTNALLRALEPERKRVLFLAGHGEKNPDTQGERGYAEIGRQLGLENYDVGVLTMVGGDTIPAGTAALIIAGPETPVFPYEVEAIRRYLASGGGVFLGVDPVFADGRVVDLGLDSLLAPYSVALGKGIVFDESPASRQAGLGFSLAAAEPSGKHVITASLARERIVFPDARAVRTAGQRGRWAILARTGSRTWEDLDPLEEKPEPTPGRDIAGPIPMAVSVAEPISGRAPDLAQLVDPTYRNTEPESRLVVVGDSDFVTDARVAYRPNRDFFLNAVAWLAHEENRVAVRPRDPEERVIRITAPQKNFLRLASVILYPAAILTLGVATWARRRRRDV